MTPFEKDLVGWHQPAIVGMCPHCDMEVTITSAPCYYDKYPDGYWTVTVCPGCHADMKFQILKAYPRAAFGHAKDMKP